MADLLEDKKTQEMYQKLDIAIWCIEREDNLRHQRLSWALQVNVAVVAFIFLYNQQSNTGPDYFTIVVGSIIGFSFSLVSLFAINAASSQLQDLFKYIRKEFGVQHDEDLDAFHKRGFPRPYGDAGAFKFGTWAPNIYCSIFALAWFMIFVTTVFGAPQTELPGPPPAQSQVEPSPTRPAR